jgi:hypothetical protein
MDLDTWLDDYRPYTTEVSVCGRADLVARRQQLDVELSDAIRQAKSDDLLNSPAVAAARRAVDDNDAAVAAAQRTFRFAGIGNEAWHNLKRAHPPGDSDRLVGNDTNLVRFAPALIAAASADDPKVTVDQATKLMGKLPPGEFDKLFDAALQANGQVIAAPKSDLAALIDGSPLNGGSSTTSLPEASPDPSPSADDDAPSPESSETNTGD